MGFQMPFIHWEMKDDHKFLMLPPEDNRAQESGFKYRSSHKKGPKSVFLLGNILLLAAKLYQALEFSDDKRMIDEYIHSTPPLHPRRTLTQFKNLGSTHTDKDLGNYMKGPLGRKPTKTENQKLIMVDQLWLWIIDDREFSNLL